MVGNAAQADAFDDATRSTACGLQGRRIPRNFLALREDQSSHALSALEAAIRDGSRDSEHL